MKLKLKQNKCKHFTGLMNDECDKGVIYRDNWKGIRAIPCLNYNSESEVKDLNNNYIAVCEKFKTYTIEELEQQEKEIEEHMNITGTIIKTVYEKHGINPKAGPSGKSFSGKMVCPRCNGHVAYSIAGINNHIHAKCFGDGCFSFMM